MQTTVSTVGKRFPSTSARGDDGRDNTPFAGYLRPKRNAKRSRSRSRTRTPSGKLYDKQLTVLVMILVVAAALGLVNTPVADDVTTTSKATDTSRLDCNAFYRAFSSYSYP